MIICMLDFLPTTHHLFFTVLHSSFKLASIKREKCQHSMADKWRNQAFGSFSFAATDNTSMLAKAELGETGSWFLGHPNPK